MILVVIGQHESGKTHFLRALSNIFFEFRGHDGLTYAQVLDQEPVILRDAGANELVVVTLDPEDMLRHRAEIAALLDKWGEYTVVQVVQTVPFVPRSGKTW